jgi:hypothetical protein
MPQAHAAPAVATTIASPAVQALETKYGEQLKLLRAEILKALPTVDDAKKSAIQQSREAVTKATANAKAAKEALGKIGAAKGLVDHAKGKWIGGAEKGISAAEKALKSATTDDARKSAQQELAKWQANKQDGIKALAERQAAYDQIKLTEPALIAAEKSAQSALAQAVEIEKKAVAAVLTMAAPLLSNTTLDAKLVKCAILANATPRGLAEYAAQSKEHAALVDRLLSNPTLMQAMLTAGGAEGNQYGRAMEILSAIQKASSRAQEGLFYRLALATSLEHAVPIKQNNPAAATSAPATVDPVKRYQHFEKAFLAGELDPAFKDFTAWEYRNVVNGDEPEETLTWGREMLRNYRPDHILNPDYGWRYSKAVATDVRYGSEHVKDDLPELQSYQNIIKNGGICGRRAFFGRFILRAFGIPTLARPQRGHAALTRWTPNGWVVNLGAGWGNPDAKGVMELSDTDFLLETQIRKNPAAHTQCLRVQWAADAIGEPKYVSLKPGTGGFWNNLAVFAKKAAVADAKPVALAALGQELGEANESAESRARVLVKTTISDADKKPIVAPNGMITIPAAAFTGAQVLGSFGGGHQLFSGAGSLQCEVQIPKAGKYALTARVVTVQDNPNLQLVTTPSSQAAEIPVPYTMGKWKSTPATVVQLSQGKNTLRFTRPEGSRGLTIKDITLQNIP